MAKKSQKIAVKSIEIEYPDGESKVMSVEDARALMEQLHDLFGEGRRQEPLIIHRWDWSRWRPYPFYTVKEEKVVHEQPVVWCCESSQ